MLATLEVQDWTAIAIVILTAALVGVTWRYTLVCLEQAVAAKQSAQSAAHAAMATDYTTRAQLWLEAQRLVRDNEFYNARTKIMAQQRPVKADEWREDPLEKDAKEEDARSVCRDMDQLAWLVKLERFPEGMPADIWDDIFSKTWIVLKLLVLNERSTRGPGQKWDAFAERGEAAVKSQRWPPHWPEPKESVLNELGWKWDDVRPNGMQTQNLRVAANPSIRA